MLNALCFYPNGNPSLEDDIPCGVGSAVGCCPLNWACLANGLCYLQNENYYGRYTCTDQSWGAGCPNICTYNNTAKGNEAVLECTKDSYCCDTNRPELSGGTDCCDASPSRFSIDGNAEVPSTSDSQLISVSAAATPTSAQTSTTATVAAPSLICDSQEQTSCGSICCATDQYCAFAGQCSATSVTTESSSSSSSISASTPTFESIVSAARTSSSNSIPTATRPTSITTSESASLAAVPSITSTSVTSPSTLRTSKSSAASTTTPAGRTPSTASSPSVTNTTKFKAGVPVGAAVFLALLLLVLCCWRRRRRRRQRGPPISGNTSPGNVTPTSPGVAEPPFPNPYTENFPLSDLRSPTQNRSRSKITILPDNHPGDHPPQTYLQHAPALNPYRVSAPPGTAFGDQEDLQNRSPAPSYSPEDPARRFRTSRSRQTLTGRISASQGALGPESEGA